MADFTDRIKLIYSVTADQATSGFAKVKSGVGEAEGAFGKLKAAGSGAMGAIADNAALGATAAAGVIATFIASSVSKFEELALAANNLGDAVGLSVEDASRWIEVTDDLGVSVESLQGAVGKLNVATAGGVLDKLGIGGDTTNDRLINTLQYLHDIPDAADRSKRGVQLFGKSWMDLSPLVETSKDLRASLAAVSDQKVIDEGEVQKAKDLRDAMDRLSDTWDNFILTIGGSAIQIVADAADTLGNLADAANTASDTIGGLDLGSAFDLLNPVSQLGNLTSGLKQATDFSGGWQNQLKGLGSVVTGNIPVIGGLTKGLLESSDAQAVTAVSADDLAKSQLAAAEAAKAQAEADATALKGIQQLNDAMLAAFNSTLGLADATDKTTDAIATYAEKNDAAAQSSFGNAKANDEASRAMNDAEQAALAQAAAAVKLDADQQAAAGTAQTVADKNRIMANTLEAIAGTLDPSSPLYKNIVGYAAQIEMLPHDVNTLFNADTEQAKHDIQALTDQINNLVGRIFHVNVQANTPAGTAVAGSSAPTVGGLRAVPAGFALPVVNTFNVSVTVPPGAPSAEIGRYVADALVLHQRRVGTQRVA